MLAPLPSLLKSKNVVAPAAPSPITRSLIGVHRIRSMPMASGPVGALPRSQMNWDGAGGGTGTKSLS
jgi:hypothetical protein